MVPKLWVQPQLSHPNSLSLALYQSRKYLGLQMNGVEEAVAEGWSGAEEAGKDVDAPLDHVRRVIVCNLSVIVSKLQGMANRVVGAIGSCPTEYGIGQKQSDWDDSTTMRMDLLKGVYLTVCRLAEKNWMKRDEVAER